MVSAAAAEARGGMSARRCVSCERFRAFLCVFVRVDDVLTEFSLLCVRAQRRGERDRDGERKQQRQRQRRRRRPTAQAAEGISARSFCWICFRLRSSAVAAVY